MPRWSKEEAFPIIKRIIEQLCLENGSADRDQIASAMLDDGQGRQLIESSLHEGDRTPFNEAGNVVDWFSAELTK